MSNVIILHPEVHTTKRLSHIEAVANGRLRTQWTNETGDEEVFDYDLSKVSDQQGPSEIGIEIEEPLLSMIRYGDDYVWHFMYFHAEGVTLPTLDSQGALPAESGLYPLYPLWPSGETESALAADEVKGHGTDLTDLQKKHRAVEAIKRWRIQLRSWIQRSLEYADLHADIPSHIGYWLRSADAVIKYFFEDPDTDYLITEAIALRAAEGPPTIDNIHVLLQNLLVLMDAYPTGPTIAAIWVKTRKETGGDGVVDDDLTDPSEAVRQSLSTALGNTHEQYTLASDYDSTDESWITTE